LSERDAGAEWGVRVGRELKGSISKRDIEVDYEVDNTSNEKR
jgi:hypothetical protein